MSISQLFILSRRGDSIIYRDFRRDIKKSNDKFFHNVNFRWYKFYICKNRWFIYININIDNASPNYYLEVLDRIIKVINDHIGLLNEETIRKNFVLIYEIINEMIDFSYPQLSENEQVKEFVFTEPIVELKNLNRFKEIFIQILNQMKEQNVQW